MRITFAAALIAGLVLSLPLQACSASTSQNSDSTNVVSSTSAATQAKLKPVLAPDQFFGTATQAYQAAKECPEICTKLFCWCGCDLTDQHSSLLDCFASEHGADCEICQKEAFMALTMKKEGKSLSDIQRAVDTKYEKEYPYDHPSSAVMRYRQERLWKPGSPGPTSSPTAAPAKLLPGKKPGNCCGAHSKSTQSK
jgi:hypothetical protein